MNMSQKNLDALLALASKKLGTSPEELRKSLENGNLSNALKGMSASDNAALQQALSNPKLAEKLLSTSQAQEMFKKITNDK